jgi:hypothetical protein
MMLLLLLLLLLLKRKQWPIKILPLPPQKPIIVNNHYRLTTATAVRSITLTLTSGTQMHSAVLRGYTTAHH